MFSFDGLQISQISQISQIGESDQLTKRFHLSEDSPKLIRRPTLSWEHLRAFKSCESSFLPREDWAFFKNDKVWLAVGVQLPPLGVDRHLGLGHEGDAPELELDLESVLICGICEICGSEEGLRRGACCPAPACRQGG